MAGMWLCSKLALSCRYEGRDWRKKDASDCDGDRELFKGIDTNFAALQEAMFIPGKEGVLQTSEEILGVASAYERWMEKQVGPSSGSLVASALQTLAGFETRSHHPCLKCHLM